jgi:hypothetical protein
MRRHVKGQGRIDRDMAYKLVLGEQVTRRAAKYRLHGDNAGRRMRFVHEALRISVDAKT